MPRLCSNTTLKAITQWNTHWSPYLRIRFQRLFLSSQSSEIVQQQRKMLCNPFICARHKCSGVSDFFFLWASPSAQKLFGFPKEGGTFRYKRKPQFSSFLCGAKQLTQTRAPGFTSILWLRQTFLHSVSETFNWIFFSLKLPETNCNDCQTQSHLLDVNVLQ